MFIKSGIVVSALTLLSRVFGLVREQFIAYCFGASNLADSVNIAFKLPNLFRRIFGEGALSTVFVPLYNRQLAISQKKAKAYSGKVISLLTLCLIILVAMMQLLMPQLMYIIAPGFIFDSEKLAITTWLCQLSMPYILLISIVALIGGILNSVRKFAAFAFAPVLMNVGIISFTLILQQHISLHEAIIYSLILSGIVQLAFMLVCQARAGLMFSFNLDFKDSEIKKLIKNMGPATLSAGAGQINIFLSQSIASFIPTGVSVLSYADRLYQLPLSLIGISFGTILLPELSKLYQQKALKEASQLQNKAIKLSLALSLPAMLGLMSLSLPIIHIIYERGAFDNVDTLTTSSALFYFSIGLPAFILAKILMPIFYANYDTKTPFKITIYYVIANCTLNIILMQFMSLNGIALGSSISAWFNALMLLHFSKKLYNFELDRQMLEFSVRIIASCILMLIAILTLSWNFHRQLLSGQLWYKVMILTTIIIIGAGAYFAVLFLQKNKMLQLTGLADSNS